MSQAHLLFSRPVLVTSLPDDGMQTTIETRPEERAALAEANGIVAIDDLGATFELMPQRVGKGVAVRGQVVARVVQTCTVSLEHFESELREPVDLLFVPAGTIATSGRSQTADVEADLSSEDPPEVIHDGRIDLGAITAEFLALGLDPYPRKPGVTFEAERYAGPQEPSPFAVLARFNKEL